jgi:hypothetical protein
MKFTNKQFVSLVTNGTVVDIHIQVPAQVGQELVDQFNQGVTEFSIAPTDPQAEQPEAPSSEPDVPVPEEEKPRRSKK